MRTLVAVAATWMAAGSALAGMAANFDDLTLAADSYWNGSADPGAGGFDSGFARFNNTYGIDPWYGYPFWNGWAYSNMTDSTTPGYTNQYSAIPGGAQSGSNYGVGYPDTYNVGGAPTITFASPRLLDYAYFTNTTYAYYSLRDGDGWAKKFGGATGDDPDKFYLTITGRDVSGAVTGTVDFYLADFRFTDNSKDYIIQDWTAADLTPLGLVKSVEFALTSSDSDPLYGMNTPAYFAMDSLTPEPGTLALVGLGAALLRRRRHQPKP